jgi:DNA invertase Pin-like site-specific DNA recombinase
LFRFDSELTLAGFCAPVILGAAVVFRRPQKDFERTRAGLEVARKLGRKGGRKRQMTDSKIKSAKKLLASGVPPHDVANNLGVSVPTLYRWIPASTMA